jgi:hypothetical protein
LRRGRGVPAAADRLALALEPGANLAVVIGDVSRHRNDDQALEDPCQHRTILGGVGAVPGPGLELSRSDDGHAHSAHRLSTDACCQVGRCGPLQRDADIGVEQVARPRHQ